MAPAKRKPAEKKKSRAKKSKSGAKKSKSVSTAERLEHVTNMLDLVLKASLRGRLLPSERKEIKAYLEERRKEKRRARAERRRVAGPRCPACRLSIPDEKAERCPHCSVLLAVASKSRRKRKA